MQYAVRAIIAVLVAVMLFLLLPPVLRLLQIGANGDLMTIFRVVIGFGALIYIIKGKPVPLG
jgi:hypothetical protein